MVKAGIKPVSGKSSVPGGLFRSIHRGDFVVDIGRRIIQPDCKVDVFGASFSAMTTANTRIAAVLFNGHILDMSPAFRGFRRGMPWSMLLGCGLDFLWSRAKPASLCRETWKIALSRRGRQLTRIAAGFPGKAKRRKWSDIL
jgi:hypothetical protein